MKKPLLFIAAILGLLAAGCESKGPAPSKTTAVADSSPFESIVVRDGRIIGTLPAVPHWVVIEGSAEPRRPKPGESFIMEPGSSLLFAEHHCSYRVTARLAPEKGLLVESKFDARSFGGELTKKKYFLPAKEAGQVTTPDGP